MRAILHRFLLMLLMLSLPLQALASVSMLACALDAVPAHLTPAPMLMATGHESHHPDSAPAAHDGKHCPACALAAALPVPLNAHLPLAPSAQCFMIQPAVSFNGFIPSSPERPPRLSRA